MFLPGSRSGLSDNWVESQRLERHCDFVVACTESSRDEVLRWGISSASRLEELSAPSAIPRGWILFRGSDAQKSHPAIPCLSLPQETRISLAGGIKTGKGNTYVEFAPPRLLIEGNPDGAKIKLDGSEIDILQAAGEGWQIPKGTGLRKTFTAELELSGQAVSSRKVILVPTVERQDWSLLPMMRRDGLTIETEDGFDHVQGAVVHLAGPVEWGEPPRVLPTHLSSTIVFIGPTPGQVFMWPEEDPPEDWSPAWALAKSKKSWRAFQCGRAGDNLTPVWNGRYGDSRRVKLWKNFIWGNRKRTVPPRLRGPRRLWDSYLEVAKSV